MNRKRVEDLIPKSKFDCSNIEALNRLSNEEIEPIISELIAWMKDMNWPVAKEMPTILSKHQKQTIPHIIEILKPEQPECDWKSFIIYALLPLFNAENLLKIKPALKRIADNPTVGELSDETNLAAEELLREKGWLGDGENSK